MARAWKNSSQDALRDYKSCERENLITQRTPSIEELTEHQDLCGKHHQVARALEAVTISNMTTTEEPQVEEKQPVEKKVVGKCRCAEKPTLHAKLKATSRTCAP